MTTSGTRQARLGWTERLGYGVGDLGFNLYWTTIASFLAAFYTDVFGISAAAAGTIRSASCSTHFGEAYHHPA